MRLIAAAILLSLSVWPLAARADDSANSGKQTGAWKVFAECRMATLPQKAAISLIEEFGETEKANDAWDHLERMLENGDATQEADLIVQGAVEKPLASKCVEEVKYPSEYNPPYIPQHLSLKAASEALKIWPLIGASPTAFETRDVGERIEFKARVLDDGAWIAISVQAIHSRLREQAKFDFAELPGGEKLSIHQPQFNVLESKSSFRLRNGEKILLGVHKLANPEKTFELFVLQVKASRAGEAR
jgi:hypothetical protein